MYATEVPLALHDVSPDGRVLVGEGFSESDITFVGGGTPGTRSLAWRALDFAPRLSADGRVVLFSSWEGGKLSALLRETSGSPPKDLGRGAGLDLTPDGRTALLGAPERDLLWLAATGAASRRSVRGPELNFEAVRLLAGGTSRAVATAQTSSDLEWRLYSIDLETGATSPVSPRAVDPDVLEASPDGTMAAAWTTVEGQKYPTIFPLPGGEPIMLRSLGPDVAPAGWASNDELWLTRVEGPDPSSFELIRFDVKRTASHERRSIGSGVGLWHRSVHVTPDGKNVVFMQERVAGHLYVLRGLVGAH